MPSPKHPALTYALRGIIAFEITLHGPARDLHSGIFGGAVDNPAMALVPAARQAARQKRPRRPFPDFTTASQPLSAYERKQFARLPVNATRDFKSCSACQNLFGERGFTPTEQRSARPTFEINGLTSGYQGEGSKTIVPAWARAKITCRLVPNQKPAHVRKAGLRHLKKICPPTVRLEIEAGHGAEAYLVSPTEPAGAGGVARARSRRSAASRC